MKYNFSLYLKFDTAGIKTENVDNNDSLEGL